MNVLDEIFYIEVQKLSDIKLVGNKRLSFTQLLLESKPILKRTVFLKVSQDHRTKLFVIN